MRVLVDGGYRSQARGTGIATYSRSLAKGLSQLGHDVLWLSGANATNKPDALSDAAHVANDPDVARGPRAYFETASNMLGGLLRSTTQARILPDDNVVVPRPNDLPQDSVLIAPNLFVHAHYRHMLLRRFSEIQTEEKVDVLHLTAPLPIEMKGVKTVVTIHDLVPLRLPYSTSDNKREFVDRVRTSVRKADLVVTVSDASKREIVNLLQVDPDRVCVTWQPSDIEPLTNEEQSRLPRSLARFGLQEGDYALFVGAIEPKKNVRRLIEAFLDAHDTMPLILVGPKAWKWQQEIGNLDRVLGASAQKRVRLLGHVSHDDLRRLYAGARMLTFPSLHEGFGLPPLEAMRMGCPVLASRAGGLSEVCGDAALFVEPLDRDDMTRKIEQIILDSGLRGRLREAGFIQSKQFSVEAFASRIGAAYSRLSGV